MQYRGWGSHKSVKLLLEAGAGPNIKNEADATPTSRAAKSKSIKFPIVASLTCGGGNLKSFSKAEIAGSKRKKDGVSEIIDRQCNIGGKFDEEYKNKLKAKLVLDDDLSGPDTTPIQEALLLGRKELKAMIEDIKSSRPGELIDEINALNRHGSTALHYATDGKRVVKDRKKIVELLLKEGADPNIQNKSGNTPLYNAPNLGANYVRELVQYNGDLFIKNNVGKSPFDQVKKYCPRYVSTIQMPGEKKDEISGSVIETSEASGHKRSLFEVEKAETSVAKRSREEGRPAVKENDSIEKGGEGELQRSAMEGLLALGGAGGAGLADETGDPTKVSMDLH